MASAEELGEVIIYFGDKNYGNAVPVFTRHTVAGLSQATTAPTGANYNALPNLPGSAYRCKGRVWLSFRSDAADTIESEESKLSLPLRIYSLADGRFLYQKVLTLNNMTGFTAAGTVDKVLVADEPTVVAYWDVPSGTFAMLDAGQKVHCYMGDDT